MPAHSNQLPPMRIARRALCLVAVLLGLLSAVQTAEAADLVMFDQRGCYWCQRWNAEVAPAYSRSAEGRIAPLRRVDIRAQRTAGIALASPVTTTPTFVLVDHGREVGRITGYPGADFFWGLLDGLVKKLHAARPAAKQQAI